MPRCTLVCIGSYFGLFLLCWNALHFKSLCLCFIVFGKKLSKTCIVLCKHQTVLKILKKKVYPVYKLPIFWGLGEVIVRKPTPKKKCQRNRKNWDKKWTKANTSIIAFVWVHSIFVTLIRRDYVNYATYLLLIWSLL